jgi:hypothetical protein
MTYVIAEPCVDLKDKARIEECPVEAIYYEDDLPDQWSGYTQLNADFFERLGSPGGAAKVGVCEHDPSAIKQLQPMGGHGQ